MTVAELITELERFPMDMPVNVSGKLDIVGLITADSGSYVDIITENDI